MNTIDEQNEPIEMAPMCTVNGDKADDVMNKGTRKSMSKTSSCGSDSIAAAIPKEFLCPLSNEIMTDPMMTRYGDHFERSHILAWLEGGCPVTGRPLRPSNLVSNKTLKWKIEQWIQMHDDDSAECTTTTLHHSHSCPSFPKMAGMASSSSSPSSSSTRKALMRSRRTRSNRSSEQEEKKGFDNVVSAPPSHFKCALTNQVMADPVMARNGINFERKHILRWLESSGYVCPVTTEKLRPSKLIPNSKLAREIEEWKMLHSKAQTKTPEVAEPHADPVQATSTIPTSIPTLIQPCLKHSTSMPSFRKSDMQRLSKILAPPKARRRTSRHPGAGNFRSKNQVHLISLISEIENVLEEP
eukprot:CAMPEP_0198136292 /NCGR_PEP_ID=MMETSP1442-20131203/61038_1 /TAXON_ID= /ORGANISM="Craspedostauros australis, Strain CCMP3328" /LENGTH=355 /DNA_ID=CAMNT_0043797501 /DNA_START=185 /DNA_END=1252 /DNA_ORIENTATION=-